MSNDDSRVHSARIEQICVGIDEKVEKGFEHVNKRMDKLEDGLEKLDGKFEMSRKEIHDLDKRVSKNESTIKAILWVAAIFAAVFVGGLAYTALVALSEYVTTYGIP